MLNSKEREAISGILFDVIQKTTLSMNYLAFAMEQVTKICEGTSESLMELNKHKELHDEMNKWWDSYDD